MCILGTYGNIHTKYDNCNFNPVARRGDDANDDDV